MTAKYPLLSGPRAAAPSTRPAVTPLRVEIVEHGATRPGIEQFIRADFRRVYGADVHHFLPRLMGLRDEHGTLLAALGCRFARRERLFLEQYIDVPIQTLLATRSGAPVRRPGIVEVGNLAVSSPGGARWLIVALTAYLAGAGYEWAVFTAVPALANSFVRLGVALTPLATADIERLPPAERSSWGSYYDTCPTVMAASVAQSYAALTAYLDLPRDRHRLAALWHGAGAAGNAASAGA